ncbi:MAG: ATP-binding protein [Steroidobacteraceae bacterium]|nr:ATP-binding protein [Steroidobacteraceae bacterium]
MLRTTAMRLALWHALLLVAALAAMLGALLLLIERYTAQEIDSALVGEARALATLAEDNRAQSIALLTQLQGTDRRLRFYRLEDPSGRRLAGSLPSWPAGLTPDARAHRIELEPPIEADDDFNTITKVPAVGMMLPDGSRLMIAQAAGDLETLRALSWGVVLAVLGIASLLALVTGLSLGWRWLARIDAISAVAGRIAAGDLGQRVFVRQSGDEFDLLAQHLNAMLGRIEGAVTGMREISDHVAHDLRKPLTRLNARIEAALRQMRDAQSYRSVLQGALRDSREILATFEALLTIARLEANSELLERTSFDLSALAAEMAELYGPEAEDAGRSLSMDATPAVFVVGSPALVRQALANLLDNAFKYTPRGSPVEVRIVESGNSAHLMVVDHGYGLSDDDKLRLRARFTRGDSARSTPGNGLGLALVAAIAHAHGGELLLADTRGGGLTATVCLPATQVA